MKVKTAGERWSETAIQLRKVTWQAQILKLMEQGRLRASGTGRVPCHPPEIPFLKGVCAVLNGGWQLRQAENIPLKLFFVGKLDF